MRIECPHCNARVRLDEPPEDDTPIRCTQCKKKFAPPDPDEDDDRPARKGGRKGGKKRRGDDEGSNKTVQMAVAGGVVVVAAIVGIVVVVMNSGGPKPNLKPGEVAVANPPPAQAAPQPAPVPQQTPQPGTTPKGTAPAPGGTKVAGPAGPGGTQAPPGGGTTTRPSGTGAVATPAEYAGPYADLFRQPVNAPPKTVKVASLRPTAADLVPEVPTFHSLLMARKSAGGTAPPAPKGAKLTLDEVKRACAFIKVDAGDRSSSGSGFLIAQDGTAGLVATNHHVIEAATRPRFGSGTSSVTVVFNSGLADEKVSKAAIVAYDPFADVAVLRVEGTGGAWPKPINPYNALPKVTEGVDIQFWGFPLGAKLALGRNKNPEITLGKGSVSSLRYTPGGRLDRIQISGTMNPGNSGGPLVDSDGRLVGIAVEIWNPEEATGIGFAVPVNDLIALLEGRLMNTVFVPTALEGGRAKFLVFVPVMDPLDRVDTVFVRRWAGSGMPPEAVKDALTGYKPFGIHKSGKANLSGVDEFPLKKFRTEGGSASGLGIALGEMDVPMDAEQVQIQIASQTAPNLQTGAKLTAASKPVGYTLSVGDQSVGADAGPFTDLTADPDGLAGKVLVVKGRVAAPPNTREAVQELIVVGLDGRRPDRMRFLVDRAAAAQFDEVIPEHQPHPVRLVCLVGRRGADGLLPVRVARLDFIGRGDRVVRTIPAASDPADELAGLNRDVGKFAGKTMQLTAAAVPFHLQSLQAGELAVVFPNSQHSPRNLAFTISPAMRQRLIGLTEQGVQPGMVVRTRITALVPAQPAPPGGRTTLTVTKIEITDREGKVVKTIE